MGNPAIVAFRNSDGTYDMHSSPDGGSGLQLLFPLSIAAASASPDYRDFVAALDAPEASLATASGLDHHLAKQRETAGQSIVLDSDPSTLLHEDPFATDIPADELMANWPSHLVHAGHLYVVEDEVELYYSAWGSIGLLDWFADTCRIEAYDRDRVASPAQVDALVDRQPDYTYEGDDFGDLTHGSSSDTWYTLFRDQFQQIGGRATVDAATYSAHGQDLTSLRVINPDWVFVVTATGDTISPPDRVSRAKYPIRIPLNTADDLDEVATLGLTVEQAALDIALYLDAMAFSTDIPTSADGARMKLGTMYIDNLRDKFPDRFETRFLPFS